MKKHLHVFFLIGCLAVGLFGCSADDEDPRVIADISDDFYIDLWEVLKSPARSFALNVETIDAQECANTLLDYTSKRSGISLTVSLNDLLAPHPTECVEAPGAIKTSIELGYLAVGKYDVQINLKNAVINEGILTVTDDAYHLAMYTDEGFHLRQTSLLRVPENSFWGYVAYDDNAAATAAQNFIADLKAVNTDFSPGLGYYGYYTVENNKKIVLRQPPTANTVLPFVLKFGDNPASAKAVLEQYRSTHSNLQLKIFTSAGEEW